jgi:hypothetical protein
MSGGILFTSQQEGEAKRNPLFSHKIGIMTQLNANKIARRYLLAWSAKIYCNCLRAAATCVIYPL